MREAPRAALAMHIGHTHGRFWYIAACGAGEDAPMMAGLRVGAVLSLLALGAWLFW